MREMEDARGLEAGLGDHTEFDPADFEPRPFALPDRKRSLLVGGVLVAVLLMVVLPPLINVNRFRRQIARSISASLNRPVHMDAVTLNLLPIPGFTLDNFVVGEDPAFGWEPVIRANSVRARLRLGSLWRGRVEFSRISLTDASVNLVHRSDGRWNIEDILLQASKIQAAPTAQIGAGGAPRFPYIEATGARVNLKMGLEKMPLALTEGEFALWLPQPEQWRLRLEGRPSRTDSAATDTGTVRLQGTLGKAGSLKDVPVELSGEWNAAPLGGVSKVLMGTDAGLRGDVSLRVSVAGKVGENTVDSLLQLRQVRRAEFVPARSLDVDVACQATTRGVFHEVPALRCAWPPDAGRSGLAGVVVRGRVPEVHSLQAGEVEAEWSNVPLSGVLDVLREASARVSTKVEATGSIQGSWKCCGPGPWLGSSGVVELAHGRMDVEGTPVYSEATDSDGELTEGGFRAGPFALELGGSQPAMLDLKADGAGVEMHLYGTVLRSRLLALGRALPPVGDGLDEALPVAAGSEAEMPMRVDLVGRRGWTGRQTWSAVVVKVPAGKRKGRHR